MMFPGIKKTLAQLAVAGVAIGLLSPVQAALKEGDMVGEIGISQVVTKQNTNALFEGYSKVPQQGKYHVARELQFRRDSSMTTARLDFMYMVTDSFGVDIGYLWPSTIKQKLRYSIDSKYEADLSSLHVVLKWFFMTPDDKYRPYFGFGPRITDFKKESVKNIPLFEKITLDSSVGAMATAGVVYLLDKGVFLDASWNYFSLNARGYIRGRGAITLGEVRDIKLDPWTLNLSYGFKF